MILLLDLNSKDDLVSVVIPVYNSEKFLKQAIESVLNQTYKNIEIITIDDGSTDSSLEILKQYSDRIIIISQKNQGLTAALNAGISKMNGKWLKWFSPDDILCSQAIEILVREAKKFPKDTIIYSNWELINENNEKLRDFNESNFNDLENFDFNVRLLDNQLINVNTSLIPTTLFKKHCKIQNLSDPVAIDYDFFLRAALLYETNFYLIEESLVKYRVHPGQLSHKKILQTLNYLEHIRNQIFSLLDEKKKSEYEVALEKFQKEKSVRKKTLEFGLKIATKLFPEWVSDSLLVIYLNKIRRSR